MRKIFFVFTLILISVLSVSCTKNDKPLIKYGTYKLETETDAVLKSSLTLNEDKTFMFFYDPLSSYLNTGSYKISGDIITAENGNGEIFLFGITDEDTLFFIEEGSADTTPIDESFSSPIADGSIFKFTE